MRRRVARDTDRDEGHPRARGGVGYEERMKDVTQDNKTTRKARTVRAFRLGEIT